MRLFPVALAAAAVLLACSPARPGASGGARRLVVDARASAAGADGSEQRPFATIGAALAAARDGDTVALRDGLHSEQVRVERAVTLTGSPAAVLAGPADGAAIELLAPATLEGFVVRGGAVGVRVAARAVLRGLHLSGQELAGVRVAAGRAELSGCVVETSSERRERVGLAVAPGAELAVAGGRIAGPFRWGVEARGGSFSLDGLEVIGAMGGVLCTDGCRGSLRASVLAQGRGAGVLAGEGARLEARDNLVSGWEQCFVAHAGAELVLDDNATALCGLESVAAVSARLEARHHLHVGPSRTAGITVIGGRALVDECVLLDPGPIGLMVRGGETQAHGLLARGARSDADGTFGDGVFAIAQDSLRLEQVFLEANQGAGLTVQNGPVVALGLEAQGNRLAGIEAQNGARATLVGANVSGSRGPALLAIEASRIEARGERLDGNTGGAAFARCEEGAAIVLERTDVASACVNRWRGP